MCSLRACAVGESPASSVRRFVAIIENTALRNVFFASNAFWICGRRFVGRPDALSGSGTKCGCSDASHLCLSASAAVGREVGSMVRHSETKSRAVSETLAQYSSECRVIVDDGHVQEIGREGSD